MSDYKFDLLMAELDERADILSKQHWTHPPHCGKPSFGQQICLATRNLASPIKKSKVEHIF